MADLGRRFMYDFNIPVEVVLVSRRSVRLTMNVMLPEKDVKTIGCDILNCNPNDLLVKMVGQEAEKYVFVVNKYK